MQLSVSRIHALQQQPFEGCELFVKREDELGGEFLQGNKTRKYASLLPWLKSNGFEQAYVIAGGNSNHAVAAAMLLRQNQIPFRMYLKESHSTGGVNAALLALLLRPEERVEIPAAEWQRAEERASKDAAEQERKTYVIPEGAACAPAFAGAASLADECIHQMPEAARIFIDAGTGFTASAFIHQYHWQQHAHFHHPVIHIVLMAQDPDTFKASFQKFCAYPLPDHPAIRIHQPLKYRKFGKTGVELFNYIQTFAQTEGILLDPVYNAKLFMTASGIIQEEKPEGKILLINSGGSHVLPGFGRSVEV